MVECCLSGSKKVIEKAGIQPEEIAGIGIDGQSWSAIAMDKDGNVLTNTPIWMDTRAQSICDRLNEEIGADKIFEVSGNSLQPSYTTAKILWYKENLPEVYAKIDKILQSNSYIAYKLTGVMSQDVSQGYGLHCFDMRKAAWDEEMCKNLESPWDFFLRSATVTMLWERLQRKQQKNPALLWEHRLLPAVWMRRGTLGPE